MALRMAVEVMPRPQTFLGGQATWMLGNGLAMLAVPLLTRSPVAAVLASLRASAGCLAAWLPAGVLVDRADP